MLPHQFQELLDKYTRRECTPEEEEFISNWYNSIEDQENPLPEKPDPIIKQKIWARIDPDQGRKKKWSPWLLRAAVITIPLLVCAIFYMSRHTLHAIIPSVEEVVASHEMAKAIVNAGVAPRKVALSDGSEVVLQPSSEIQIYKNFGNTKREVRLTGEAFFKVQRNPDKPFVVYSGEVVTRVLGTSFNIRAYQDDGQITVAVKTGKVSVYTHQNDASENNGNTEIILTPNQQMVYNRVRAEASKQLVKDPEVVLPNSDLFKMDFENVAVTDIFNVLEENYGIEIRYDPARLKNCRLTTSMSDEGLYERIEVICKAIGASYSIDKDAFITISSDGCK